MENYAYSSYPDSGDSSPLSREIECENSSWDEPPQQASSLNYKVKFMCSYDGKIQPRPYDNQLAYVGGETKILSVDRTIKFSAIKSKLSSLIPDVDAVCFKYQLPGEDLDALISVTNDEDLEHMMSEYDRLYRASAKPARLRLFLFPLLNPNAAPDTAPALASFGSSQQQPKSERQWFVDALNSVQIDGSSPPGNPDFLFGLDKGFPPTKLPESAPPPTVTDVATKDVSFGSDCGSEDRHLVGEPAISPTEIQRQIHELQRLHIAHNHEQTVFHRKSDEGNPRAYAAGDFYAQKVPEKITPAPATQIPVPIPMNLPGNYFPERVMTTGGGYHPVSATGTDHHQPVYLIPTPTGVYQAVRPMTSPIGQAYYGVQRMVQEAYREQPVYNAVPQQQQPKVVGGAYSTEGNSQMVQQPTEPGYTQVYYTTQGGVMSGYKTVAVDARQGGGGLNQEGKAIAKTSAT
jgi:hypothetical protein